MKPLTDMHRRTIHAIADSMRRLGEGCTEAQLLLHHSRDDLTRFAEAAREKAMADHEKAIRTDVPARRAA